jgi:hypothetical protein
LASPGAREATAPDAYAEILLCPKHFLGSEMPTASWASAWNPPTVSPAALAPATLAPVCRLRRLEPTTLAPAPRAARPSSARPARLRTPSSSLPPTTTGSSSSSRPSPGSAATVSGSLIFGIGTESNNQVSGATPVSPPLPGGPTDLVNSTPETVDDTLGRYG